MGNPGPKTWLVALIVLLWMTSGAEAQEWLRLRPLSGEVFFDFEGSWQDTEDAPSQSDLQFEEGVRLRLGGFVLSPRVMNFSLDLEPTFTQGIRKVDGSSDTRDSESLDYNGNVSLLQGTPSPVAFSVGAGRSTGTNDGGSGNRSEYEIEHLSALMTWKNKMFPITLNYSGRRDTQEFRSGLGGSSAKRDTAVRTASLSGRSSKTNLRLERGWFEDKASSGRDSTSFSGNVGHNFKWGKGSNLGTQLSYSDRRGFNAIEQFQASAVPRIRHSDTLISSGSYRYIKTKQQSESQQHAGSYNLNHRLYTNLTSNLDLETRFREDDFSRQEDYSAAVNFGYNKRIPWNGTFRAGVGAGYRLTDREAEAGVLRTQDEPHTVPASAPYTFRLTNRFVDQSTIVVRDTVDADVNDCDPCTVGLDYQVVSAGGNFTEIEILLTGRIAPGERVEVDYEYETLPSAKFYGIPYSFNVGLDFGWISLSHEMSEERQWLLSGEEANVQDKSQSSATRLDLRWEKRDTRATFTAERRYTRSGDFESDTLSFRQTLFYRMSPRATLNLNATETFSGSDQLSNAFYSANASLRWRQSRFLNVSGRLAAWIRDNEEGGISGGSGNESFVNFGLDLDWRWRAVELGLRYDHNLRRGDVSDSNEDRVLLNLSRKF